MNEKQVVCTHKVVNGVHYQNALPDELIKALEFAKESGKRFTIRYYDDWSPETGYLIVAQTNACPILYLRKRQGDLNIYLVISRAISRIEYANKKYGGIIYKGVPVTL